MTRAFLIYLVFILILQFVNGILADFVLTGDYQTCYLLHFNNGGCITSTLSPLSTRTCSGFCIGKE